MLTLKLSLCTHPNPSLLSKEGLKAFFTPFFCLQEKGAGGMSTGKAEKHSQLLLFIPDNQYKLYKCEKPYYPDWRRDEL